MKQFIRELPFYVISRIFKVLVFLFPKNRDIVIFRRDRLGDFVLWLGSAKQLREYYSGRNITLVCQSLNYEIAEKSGFFDQIVIMNNDNERFFKALQLGCKLLIQPMYSRNNLDDWTCEIIRADQKVAVDGDTANKTMLKPDTAKIYTRILSTPAESIPEIERNQIVVNMITQADNAILLADLSFIQEDVPVDKPYFVVNLGASAPYKQWGIKYFAEAAKHIQSHCDLSCVLIGSKSEMKLARDFCLTFGGRVHDFSGKTTVSEMISLIQHARFVLTNDTSTVHIAAACQTPCVCAAPGFHYPRFTVYPSDKIQSRNQLPVFVTCHDTTCFGCCLRTESGLRNECLEDLRKNRPVQCVSGISVEDFCNAADRFANE